MSECVDREEVKNFVYRVRSKDRYHEYYHREDLLEYFNKLPAVETERPKMKNNEEWTSAYKHGWEDALKNITPERLTDLKAHWIDRSAGEYRCSNCGVKIGETDITDHPINSFNYCPYCGSDMRKGDTE